MMSENFEVTTDQSSLGGGWLNPIRRSTRPWASVILPATVKDRLLRDVEEFMSDEERLWYATIGESSKVVCSNKAKDQVFRIVGGTCFRLTRLILA
jgi:hypothetical protein